MTKIILERIKSHSLVHLQGLYLQYNLKPGRRSLQRLVTVLKLKEMINVVIFGRSRFKFAKLFPEAKFEGYEYNIKYAHFSFKGKISQAKIKRICDSENIKIDMHGPKNSEV